jgi:PIN domain nuclease of toxin-antitoxin system
MIVLSEAWRIDTPVDESVYVKGMTRAITQEPTPIEEEIALRVHKLRRLNPGDRLHAQAAITSRIKVMERNLQNGYLEYRDALAVEREVLEQSRYGVME